MTYFHSGSPGPRTGVCAAVQPGCQRGQPGLPRAPVPAPGLGMEIAAGLRHLHRGHVLLICVL